MKGRVINPTKLRYNKQRNRNKKTARGSPSTAADQPADQSEDKPADQPADQSEDQPADQSEDKPTTKTQQRTSDPVTRTSNHRRKILSVDDIVIA